ncbi:hypothetical protein CL658_05830 [bacterium]|nr:hypothetical protein [bacterium]
MSNNTNNGFTFVEIFISLFILGLISSLIIPRYLSSKSYIALKTSSKELSELFFLSQQKASSFGITTNVVINYSENDASAIESFTFFLPHSQTLVIEDTIFKIPQFVTCTLSKSITSIQFYPNKSWALLQNLTPLADHYLSILMSYKSVSYPLEFYSESSTIQLIDPP